jgi:hypothetical protein
MTDFFISYTRADRDWAVWIAWVLEAAGFTTKVQAWDFGAGSNFIVEMHQAAAEAERMIAVLSLDYLGSHFGRMEWAAALAQKKELVPIRVREVAVTGLLAGIVYTDLVGLAGEAARKALLTAARKERPKPRRSRWVSRICPRPSCRRSVLCPRARGCLSPTIPSSLGARMSSGPWPANFGPGKLPRSGR